MIDRAVLDRLGDAADHVARLVAELAAADELVSELVAENEELRALLTDIECRSGARSPA